ncbi:hypothetical protein [Embleya sp. NPDC005575]|uniref:hypothetical protein n=1 Tax=Embleya sp. NPDC005575 TaxID=3156892 RepID=UPI0033A46CA8
MTTTDGDGPLAELLAAKQLDIGIVWHCASCPMQGRRIPQHIDAARHDAAEHAIGTTATPSPSPASPCA